MFCRKLFSQLINTLKIGSGALSSKILLVRIEIGKKHSLKSFSIILDPSLNREVQLFQNFCYGSTIYKSQYDWYK